MIEVRINGRQVRLEQPLPVAGYVRSLGLDPRAVAVEVNGEILERSQFETTILGQADRVEIVRMVGGGSQMASPRMRPRLVPGTMWRKTAPITSWQVSSSCSMRRW